MDIYDYLDSIKIKERKIDKLAYIGDYSLIENLKDYMVVLYTDYDSDGLNSLKLLSNYCKKNNIEHKCVLNKRKYHYGLNKEILLKELPKSTKPILLFTADLGITNGEEVEYAYKIGYDKIIITDHHHIQQLPKADLIISNKLEYEEEMDLCGCGNIFYTLFKDNFSQEELIITTIATIGDMVSLAIPSINRDIVKLGLEEINKGIKVPYLKELFDKTLWNNDIVNESDIAFNIVPIINSMSRESREDLYHKIFIEENVDYIDEAIALNTKRKEKQKEYQSYIDTIYKPSDNDFDVVLTENVDSSYLGLLSSYILHKYNKDNCVLVNKGTWGGSARSKKADLQDYIHKIKNNTDIVAGGHTYACGMSNISNLDDLNQSVLVMEHLESIYDCTIGDLFNELVHLKFNQIKPFGVGNENPLLRIKCKINAYKKFKNLTRISVVDNSSFSSLSVLYFESTSLKKGDNVEVIGTWDVDKLQFIAREIFL